MGKHPKFHIITEFHQVELYTIGTHTFDLPATEHTVTGTIADDTSVMAIQKDQMMAKANLHEYLLQLEERLNFHK